MKRKKCISRLLRKYNISNTSSLKELIDEIDRQKKLHWTLGDMKSLFRTLFIAFAIPVIIVFLDHLTAAEPLIKQFKFFLMFIATGFGIAVFSYMVMSSLRDFLWWKYDRLEIYLKEVLIVEQVR